MPYYQGLTLFFLGVTFPFFALMLLIPGKHPVFIRWFQLWLWVKCWDVGFAVVMMLDQVLFNLVSVAQFPDIGDPGPELSPDLGVVLFSLRELDPSFNLGTYYHIVSTCLAAIPPVLSQLILGVFGGGGGLIAGGMSNAADYFAQGHEVGRGHGPVTQNRLAGYEEAARAGHGQIAQAVSNVTGKANQATGAAPGTVGGMAQQFGGEGDPNFVADPTGKSTGTGYQINNSSLKAPFMARGRSAGELMNYALHSAGVEGVADGAGNVASSLTMVPFVSGAMSSMQKIPVAGDVFLNPFKAVQPGAQTARKYFMEAVKAQLDYLNNKAWWDTFNSNEVQDLASRARIYRMLEIPWVAFDGPWGDAYKIEIMQSVDFWVKGFGVASNVLGGVDGGSEKKGLMGDAAQRLGATIGAGALLYFLHQKDRAEVLPSQDDTFYQKVDSFDASSSPALAQTGNSTQEEQATLRQNLRTALATLDTNNLAYGELYPLLQKEHITQDDIDRVRYAARASKRKDEDVSVLDSAD
jgi:hypothetical protein